MNINEVLLRLSGVKRSGGGYTALCPCHNDHKPSLNLTERDGKILMSCPVCGADGAAVMEALGLPVRELFSSPSELSKKPCSTDYFYTDSLKKTRFYRFDAKMQTYEKSFCWYHLQGGQWLKGKGTAKPPLYKQKNIEWARRRGKVIYIAEGEKDVDTLTKKLKLPAVCSPHGAGKGRLENKWLSDYSALFEGSMVAILPDNDEAGQALAEHIAHNLSGIAQSVKVLDLRAEWCRLKHKGDITDVYETESPHSSMTIAETVLMKLENLIINTPEYKPRQMNLWAVGEAGNEKLNEQLYITEFIKNNKIKCINNRLYSPDGVFEDGRARQLITDDIMPYVKSNHADKAEKLLRSIKALSYAEPPKPQLDRLHVANGTLTKDENGQFTVFSEDKELCLNRIPVNYNPDAPKPERFLKYLDDVFQKDDQVTLQQFCGYCLLPTTVLQKALVIIGDGGEGKSVLGAILNGVLGESNCYNESLSVLQSQFGVANVENKLLFIDDDLSESALKNARAFKNLVTNKTTIQAQKKFVQDNSIRSYVRFICFGNFTLQALYDLSEGFQRRQLILQAKPKEPDREDNPFLDREILENEAEGVLLWLLEGVEHLILNNFKISVSERTQAQSDSLKQENDSVLLFLNECDGIKIGDGLRAHSATLYVAYERFCRDNMLIPLKERSFLSMLKAKGRRYNIGKVDSPFELHTSYVTKRARGFLGISVNESYINLNFG